MKAGDHTLESSAEPEHPDSVHLPLFCRNEADGDRDGAVIKAQDIIRPTA